MNSVARAAAACSVMLALSLAGAQQDDIVREGSGSTRARLNEMELSPFDFGLLGTLTDWKNGDALSEADAQDKVVLIAFFNAWYPEASKAFNIALQMDKKYADEGLIVIGAHHPDLWDKGQELIEQKNVPFRCAYDEKGKLRKALLSDQDPDFYLIDRAGQLRFADVRTQDLPKAVRLLIDESAEDAANLPTALAKAAAEKERKLRMSEGVSHGVMPGERLSVEFEPPDEATYERTKWPWQGLFLGKAEYDQYTEQVKHEAPTLELPDDNWYPQKPDTSGRVVVLYVFDPTWPLMRGMVREMNKLQRTYWSDVDVIGIAIYLSQDLSTNQINDQDKEKIVVRNTKAVNELVKKEPINHSILLEPPRTEELYQGLGSNVPVTRGDNIDSWGWTLIVSTDNRVRYGGHQSWDSFEKSLKSILEVDPAVKARRKAEQDELRRRGRASDR